MEDPKASPLDLAVLVRQALRFEQERIGALDDVFIAHPKLAGFDGWSSVGLRSEVATGGVRVSPIPWRPDWLAQTEAESVDGLAASEVKRRDFGKESVEGDPFLEATRRTAYRSRGQRAAVRASLSTPAGASLVVALPTGEGKSLIFQLVHSVGFVGAPQVQSKGVTLVVVPTVALAINHELDAVHMCGLEKPLAFQGGKDADNATIGARIADGSQGLCFASPEAASGSLRLALRRAAEAGHLRALIIDEAHLVDQWGTGFRTEFQELSGLRHELIAASPPGQELRTILLSATLTDASLETLQSLFGGGLFQSVAAVRLRAEPDYWVSDHVDDAERTQRVIEALLHAPRPVVLYVSEVAAADKWFTRLFDMGFRRLRKLHGRTPGAEREQVVTHWRDGNLDIVVGTSAFGLGIDYQHARSIIHACVPETLDRFYQEVGRGGRDGKAALSLIAPTHRDLKVARNINVRKVIGVPLGYSRWVSMFEGKVRTTAQRFAVRIDGRPSGEPDRIDMLGESNTDWNLRTLMLMMRAGLIRLLGSPRPRIEATGDWLEVEVIDDHHLDLTVWRDRVEPVRIETWRAGMRNLDLMRQFLARDRCPAETFETLYGVGRVSRVCSRCQDCRADPTHRRAAVSPGEPRSPWGLEVSDAVRRLLDASGRLLVTYDPSEVGRATSRRLGDALQRLNQLGLAKLLVLGSQPFDMERALGFAKRAAFFVSHVESLAHARMPEGPEVIMVAGHGLLTAQNLAHRAVSPRIFLASNDLVGPDGRRLRDTLGARTLTLEEFFARVAQ